MIQQENTEQGNEPNHYYMRTVTVIKIHHQLPSILYHYPDPWSPGSPGCSEHLESLSQQLGAPVQCIHLQVRASKLLQEGPAFMLLYKEIYVTIWHKNLVTFSLWIPPPDWAGFQEERSKFVS